MLNAWGYGETSLSKNDRRSCSSGCFFGIIGRPGERLYVSQSTDHITSKSTSSSAIQVRQGPAAVKSVNLFHRLFYEGNVDIDSIEDPLKKNAVIGFINHFGQTPKQLFKKPHPSISGLAMALPLAAQAAMQILPLLPSSAAASGFHSGGTWLHLWSINGDPLASVNTLVGQIGRSQHILCVCFSQLNKWYGTP
ncbi:hypothetical protein DAPPUDRAFT_260342 [Daphnia pulex]|uniref:BEACH domain-containing protein n=1 Tax=Daphnia pulex TaxID=6669 RepID=E9HIZ8_DAPPU|nr:hypothetical protein DAPPUDRAFT_260342 [Daphnia pulex]|eukprot:EFX68295.1 hypothetical protein DAPPUDRAFT_260342 [Daphnia pulex]